MSHILIDFYLLFDDNYFMDNYLIKCIGNDYFRDPVTNRVRIKKDGLHFGVFLINGTKLTIEWDNVVKIDQTVNLANKQVSYGKALAGGIVFGPLGAVLGGLSGGKKTERTLTIIFMDESKELKSVSFEAVNSLPIRNKIEAELKKRYGTTDRTER